MTAPNSSGGFGSSPAEDPTPRARDLYIAYAWAVDDYDFDRLRTLVTSDVRLSIGAWDGGQGVDAFINAYREALMRPRIACRHYIGNVRARVLENGTIHTGAYFQAVFHETEHTRVQTGRYRDVHVRTESGLRISHKRIEIDPTVILARPDLPVGPVPPWLSVSEQSAGE